MKLFYNSFILILISAFLLIFIDSSPKASSNSPSLYHAKDTAKSNKRKRERQAKTNEDDYYKKNFFRYEDYTYNDNIKTILLYKDGFALAPPLIQLGSDEKLRLSFDDLSGDLQNYKYTIIHCDADWKPSDLLPNEYIDGFTDDNINIYGSSFNTLQKFYHYDLTFPTDNLKPSKSGNYILKVYKDDDTEENLAFTRRFMIYEQKVTVAGQVKRATSIEDMESKQEVDFTISYSGFNISDPYSDLKVVVTQNDRWDNDIPNLKPKYIKNNILDYNYDHGNSFNGGNEFRHFDIKSVQSISDRIKRIATDSTGYQITLLPDIRRSFTTYNTLPDINGKKLIKTDEAVSNSDLEGEYAHVHFTLPYYEPIDSGNIYIFGALTDWHFQKEAIMNYNNKAKQFEGSLYVKQGYYNYEYVFLKNNASVGDETLIEGNHYETENDYSIYVYIKEQGTFYDKLIAVKRLNSVRQ